MVRLARRLLHLHSGTYVALPNVGFDLQKSMVSFNDMNLEKKEVAFLKRVIKDSLRNAAYAFDDPPLIFGWHFDALGAFVAAAVALQAAVAPPFPFPPTPDGFIVALLAYLAGQAAPVAHVVGSACIACSTEQYGQVAMATGVLVHSAWATAVWAAIPAAVRAPIATLYVPRPRVTTGACNRVISVPSVFFD